MKRLSLFLVSVLFAITSLADDHYTTAVELVNAAVKEGSSGNATNLVRFATRALERTQVDAVNAPSDIKLLLNNAAAELQKAIDHGNLGHPGEATKYAKAAALHIKIVSTK
jgi:hypothetical protein